MNSSKQSLLYNKNNSIIKYKIPKTSHDWIFNLGLFIAIFAIFSNLIYKWNSDDPIKIDILIFDFFFLLSTILFLYFHLRYRWQLIPVLLYLILLFCHIINFYKHYSRYNKNNAN